MRGDETDSDQARVIMIKHGQNSMQVSRVISESEVLRRELYLNLNCFSGPDTSVSVCHISCISSLLGGNFVCLQSLLFKKWENTFVPIFSG